MSENPQNQPAGDGLQSQKLQHNPMSARVPEKVARGIVATGFLIFSGPHEVVIDFLQFISRPAHLAARVVLAPAVAEQFLATLRENYGRYQQAFGVPAPLPRNPGERPRSAQEIYDDLKISDDVLSGNYANAVMVGHTPAEFSLDFITSFYPHAAIASRIYLAAPRVPQLIETLTASLNNYRAKPPQTPPAAP